MVTVCAHCKRVISETAYQDNKISHGICGNCLAQLEVELLEGPKTPAELRPPKDSQAPLTKKQ